MSPEVSVHSAGRYVFPCGEQLLLLQARVAVSFPVGNYCFFSRCGRRVVFRVSALLGWHVFPCEELLLLSRHGGHCNSQCGITASFAFVGGALFRVRADSSSLGSRCEGVCFSLWEIAASSLARMTF